MKTKTLQIRLDEDEYQELSKLADAEGTSISDFCRQAIRLGVASEQLLAQASFEQARRTVDRALARRQYRYSLQSALILHELATKHDIDLAGIKRDAAQYTEEDFAEGDALEIAVSEVQDTARGADGNQDELPEVSHA